ncbi:type II toxin-antitoxin system RelE/ParE family toxin [Agrobacterium sp. Ap1]|uniref:type II toxin-antitoxin system RelE/ParE family toxin n=1 Tax=Agrobacterium sp. Ap1 TaxID=2815337 RepID=UPI001A8F88E5|nr:type II toxin-antitoxin system RelE/ParE family toxin [Agrobacterium sp. Ap1]MBO0140604.1 type II toxin-antitoxin system RelE/ParE family toxin [Agrobacterium sp. Ap1]
MIYDVVFSPRAIRDLDEIFRYLASEMGVAAARGYVGKIRNYCAGFATFPHRGMRRDDIRPGIRMVGYRYKATIAFDIEKQTVTILRIYHRGRDIDADDETFDLDL